MIVSINYGGRTGNHFFQYSAAYIFAKKFGFKIISDVVENNFNLPELKGEYVELPVIEVTDENYMILLESSYLELAHYKFIGYYQLKDFILKYRQDIKSIFNLRYEKAPNDSVFVHYRIGDINGLRPMIPLDFYYKSLEELGTCKGYISSDSNDHDNVLILSEKFNLEIYKSPPLETIDFAKNFNNLILSEGTFSWWIGFLSNAENIYCNKRDWFWHGDIFILPEWKTLSYDWDPYCVGDHNVLICNKVINF